MLITGDTTTFELIDTAIRVRFTYDLPEIR